MRTHPSVASSPFPGCAFGAMADREGGDGGRAKDTATGGQGGWGRREGEGYSNQQTGWVGTAGG